MCVRMTIIPFRPTYVVRDERTYVGQSFVSEGPCYCPASRLPLNEFRHRVVFDLQELFRRLGRGHSDLLTCLVFSSSTISVSEAILPSIEEYHLRMGSSVALQAYSY